MSPSAVFRREPRGRPALGFQLDVPREVELQDAAGFACRELRRDGRPVGELEIATFAAALIIDRDGILAEKACTEVARVASAGGGPRAVSVRLPGASGFRADAVERAALPYTYVFALAPTDLRVDGGVLITIRCARPDWPAAEHILQSLRVLTHNGRVATNFDAEDGPILPVVTPTR
jgi:hypothetical protein